MIISKPLRSTLLSFALFLIFSYALIGMSFLQIRSDKEPPWYVYLVLTILSPLAIFLTYRVFLNYKAVEFGGNQIAIRYPVRKSIKYYPLTSVRHWKESIVKTGKNSNFKELEILFDDNFKINLGLREYSNYQKVHSYLEKKIGNKKLTE